MTSIASGSRNSGSHEFIECEDQAKAQARAFDDMSAGGSQAYACLYFKQGNRPQVTISTTMSGLIQLQNSTARIKRTIGVTSRPK